MTSNEDLMGLLQSVNTRIGHIGDKVLRLDSKLDAHIIAEEPILDGARTLIEQHGDRSEISARISFINEWMLREADRKELRKKIIQSAAIWAVILFLGFIFYAIRDTMLDVIRADLGIEKHPLVK